MTVIAALLSAPATAAGTTATLTPIADTYVHGGQKTTNYGTSGSLSDYGTPDVETLMRFSLPAAPAGQTLTGASLRIKTTTLSTAGSADSQSLRFVGDSWAETTVTYNTRPVVSGPVLGTLAAPNSVNTSYTVTLDATQLSSHLGTQTAFAMLGSGADGLFFNSREASTTAARPTLTLTFTPSGPSDTTPPDPPADLGAAVNGSNVELAWTASTDDVGVVGYDVYRSATSGFTAGATTLIASVTLPDYHDDGRPAGSWFYVVTARDAAGNVSPPSNQEQATVAAPPPPPPPASTLTVSPSADTYVHGTNKTTNYGTSTSLAAYGSPDLESFLRFTIPAAPAGQVLSSASLRLQSTTLSSAGSADTQQVRLSDNGWNETTVTWNVKPAVGSTVLGTLAAPNAVNTRYDIPLTIDAVAPLLGTSASLAVLGTGSDGFWFNSREVSNANVRPLLTLQFASGAPDTSPPTAPTNLGASVTPSAVALSWTAATDDVAVSRYDVYRSTSSGFAPSVDTLIGSSLSTAYTDPSRSLGTFYYLVVARDAATNSSPPSNEASAIVTTLPVVTTVAAFGDAACAPGYTVTATACRQGDVADVITAVNPDYMVALGDLQYSNGTSEQFTGSWDPTFGPFKSLTLPVLGNHEYADPAGPGTGYFNDFYAPGVQTGPFGTRPLGYYSMMIGAWQFIAINTECTSDVENGNHPMAGGCEVGSPEYQWLSDTLDASSAQCTIVAFHRPRWTSGAHPPYAAMSALWDLMVNKGVDVTISGHNHDTEIFKRIGVSGTSTTTPVLDANGVRSFIAGTGGKNLSPFTSGSTPVTAATQARDSTTFGALVLTLKDGSFDWAYHPVAGKTYTNVGTTGAFSGTDESCH